MIKRTLTFITVFTLMINLIIIGASAEIISGFSSLMFADNPQLLYQYSAPENVPEPGDTYAPILNSSISDAAPLISNVTSQTTPGSSIIIQGEGFSNATVWAYGINNSGVAEFDKCDIVNCNDNTVTAAISDRFRYGMYLIWVENGNGISRPVRVNNTTAKWLNDYDTQRGMTLSVYGENLSHDNGTNLSYVYIVGENYSSYASVSSVNPFKVTFTVPLDIPNGEYQCWVHNGHGGKYGWSNALSFNVNSAGGNAIWTGDTHTVTGNQTADIRTAINAASDYDTIYFPNREYTIDSTIRITKKLRFIGESRDGVKITAAPNETTNDTVFLVNNLPTEFSSISFEDTTEVLMSPRFLYINTYNQDSSKKSGANINNCVFYKNKTYGKSGETYENIENVTDRAYVQQCVAISAALNISVTNCTFTAPSCLEIRSCENISVTGNTFYGTWVNSAANGPLAVFLTSAKNADVSENDFYGADVLDDPNGGYVLGNRGICRSITVQNPAGKSKNLYISENNATRVGSSFDNSGEQILFEDISAYYIGKPSFVNENTIEFDDAEWICESDGVSYVVDSGSSIGKTYINGAVAVVVSGKGETQYRTISSSDENTITLDRAWDILPDEDSTIMIVTPFENAVIYNNDITGPDDYCQRYNATCGIQAYGNLLDFIVKDNTFSNMMSGVRCSPHYSTNSSNVYAVFENTQIYDNTVNNVRNGIMIRYYHVADSSNPNASEADIHVSQNMIIRYNIIRNTHFSAASNLQGIGGDGINTGTTLKTYSNWGENKLSPGDWVKGTLIEGNVFSNIANACIRMEYHQGDTVLKDNVFNTELNTVICDQSSVAGMPPAAQAIIYNAQEEESNIYGYERTGISGGVSALTGLTLVNGLQNGDFEQGLKYWGANSTKNPLDVASIKTENNGNKYMSLNTSGYYGLLSAPFKISDITAGMYIGVFLKWRGSNNLRVDIMQNNVTGGNLLAKKLPGEIPIDDGDGTWNKLITTNCLTSVAATEDNSDIYFVVRITVNGSDEPVSIDIDDVEIVIFDKYAQTGAKTSVTLEGNRLNTSGNSEYGTANEGIILDNNNRFVSAISPISTFDNFDFSNGLVNFGPKETTIGFTEKLADVGVTTENGMVKIESTTINTYYGFRSVYVTLPDNAKGKVIHAKYDVASTAMIGIDIQTESGTTGWITKIACGDVENKILAPVTTGNGLATNYSDTKIAIRIQQFNSADSAVTYIDNIELYYEDDGEMVFLTATDGSPIDY